MFITLMRDVTRQSLSQHGARLFFLSLAFLTVGFSLNPALAGLSEPDVVDHVTIEHHGKEIAPSYSLPIYQIGDIRFLSAGVGLEERKASYPPFPLKLIFAQAGGAFLSGVSVTIHDMSGNEVIRISKDQVSGPWLFVDLESGTYRVTAVRRDGTPVKQTVKVSKGQTKGVHLHWPAPHGQG
jgi:hypothetical protein